MSFEDNDSEPSDSNEETPSGKSWVPAITTGGAFREALRTLVIVADSQSVDVRGSWPVGSDDETKMWDIEITSVSRSSTARVRDSDSPVVAIVEAVAEREGVETTDLPPLQETIDPEILETLQDHVADAQQSVQFQYYGYQITVSGDGSITLDG